MGQRIDFYDDPDAPRATSLVPSANVVVSNEAGEVLLIRRSDNGNWALPGGSMDLGESLPETAVRETREETGIEVEITRLVGIYTDPRHVILYTSDGEVRQEFSVVFSGRPLGGSPTTSAETTEVRWIPAAEIGSLPMDQSMRLRLDHFFAAPQDPHLG
ncbi:NUDIX domain-containing protein [Actinoplanes sp. NPDC049596]|uniref:NUDIX hydrolase n=1 Tax=unclassified Actinoplanes TaxID=2626549 RepID=UPI003432E258